MQLKESTQKSILVQALYLKMQKDPRTAFFGAILLGMNYQAKTTGTASTDGRTLWVNEQWFEEIGHEMAFAVIFHECGHVALLHCDKRRNKGKDGHVWNQACDHAVNLIGLDAGLKFPEGCLMDRKYKNMSAEQIYASILNDKDNEPETETNPEPQGGESNDDNSENVSQDDPSNGDEEQESEENSENGDDSSDSESESGTETGSGMGQSEQDDNGAGAGGMPENDIVPCPDDEAQEEMIQNVQQAVSMGKKAGHLPADIERMFEEALCPPKDWQELLRMYMENAVSEWRDQRTYQRTNMFSQNGFYFAGYNGEALPPVTMVIDTSGSVNDRMVAQFQEEIQAITEELDISQVNVIYCDTKVHNPQVFMQGEDIELDAKGGGGTDFVPAFEYVEDNIPESILLIYFTDIYGRMPKDSAIQTIWAIWGDGFNQDVPFGEKVQLELN
jgi:predicted metal-dependent peptidase